MDYRLKEGINRRNTNCIKWDACPEDVLPMWVADMDFPCAPGIMEALAARVQHPAMGYTRRSERDDNAVIDYYARNHGISVKKEDMLFTPGVVDSLLLAVHALTEPGEKVLIQTPVYGPFYSVIDRAGRTKVENPLVQQADGKWEMDLDDLDKKLPGCRLMLLCSPHNPCGRVWPRGTLQEVLNLCKKHGVYLVADEIHCDFALDGRRNVSVLTLDGAEEGVAAAVSATKSFNIAGLDHSTFLIPDAQMRAKIAAMASRIGMKGGNLLGVLATTAAYETGDEWLAEVKQIVQDNRDLAVRELTAAGAKVWPNEGTYLLFVDLRPFGKSSDELYALLMDKAKVRLNKGTEYGQAGDGFMRLNLATTPALMQEGLRRICALLRAL